MGLLRTWGWLPLSTWSRGGEESSQDGSHDVLITCLGRGTPSLPLVLLHVHQPPATWGGQCRQPGRPAAVRSEWTSKQWCPPVVRHCSDVEEYVLCDAVCMFSSRKDHVTLWPQKAEEASEQNSLHLLFLPPPPRGACSRKGQVLSSSCLSPSSFGVGVLWCHCSPLMLLLWPALTPEGWAVPGRLRPGCSLLGWRERVGCHVLLCPSCPLSLGVLSPPQIGTGQTNKPDAWVGTKQRKEKPVSFSSTQTPSSRSKTLGFRAEFSLSFSHWAQGPPLVHDCLLPVTSRLLLPDLASPHTSRNPEKACAVRGWPGGRWCLFCPPTPFVGSLERDLLSSPLSPALGLGHQFWNSWENPFTVVLKLV